MHMKVQGCMLVAVGGGWWRLVAVAADGQCRITHYFLDCSPRGRMSGRRFVRTQPLIRVS
jgi:hypothetical protein